ncbi:MAG: acyl carrier protein [Kofleriaceae bacterium]
MTDNEAKLQSAFRTTLDLGPDVEVATLTYRGIRQWDSVAHMQLIAAIESTFDLMLDADDVIGMASYTKAREIVARHGVAL